MIRWITIGILSVALAGTLFWGYQENQEKNAILIQAENSYQKSFHELTYFMDLLHDEIGTVLAMNSHQRLSPKFVDIWRVTSEAHSNVSQLPLSLLPFNKTEEFLSNIGDFTYRTAIRNLDDEPLTDDETSILKELYTQANEIKDELRQVQHLALENNLRWMDVQLALVNNDQRDNTIIDGLRTVETNVEGYAEANSKSGFIGTGGQPLYYDQLPGEQLTEEEALEISSDIFDTDQEEDIELTASKEGADLPLYSLSYSNDSKRGYMDLSQKGGHPITILVERPMEEKELSLNEGGERAEAYIEEFGFENMQLYESAEYDKNGMYSFVYDDNGVKVYSDSIDVKVALDNGDLLGLATNTFYSNHHERKVSEPELTEDDAKALVNPSVEIHESSLAIIVNELDEEVLTYEFLGTLDNETYRIYINAVNGNEEMVEKLNGKERSYS